MSRRPKTHTSPTIFVSIASFRDVRCPYTLVSLHKNAQIPSRVIVGIVQQNLPNDDDCAGKAMVLDNSMEFKDWISSNVKMLRINAKDGRGPCVARAQVMNELFDREDWVLQVDSHTRFVPNWDEVLLDDLLHLPPKSCLSVYPLPDNITSETIPPVNEESQRICKGWFNHEKVMQPSGMRYGYSPDKSVSQRSIPFMAAGLMAYPGFALDPSRPRDYVPWDPHLPWLFQGEEVLFSMRMIAKGYKFYAPRHNIGFHFYGRGGHPKVWDNRDNDKVYHRQYQLSVQRLKYIVGQIPIEKVEDPEYTLKEIDKYGIDFNDPYQKYNYDRFLYKWRPLSFRNETDFDYCMVHPNEDDEPMPS